MVKGILKTDSRTVTEQWMLGNGIRSHLHCSKRAEDNHYTLRRVLATGKGMFNVVALEWIISFNFQAYLDLLTNHSSRRTLKRERSGSRKWMRYWLLEWSRKLIDRRSGVNRMSSQQRIKRQGSHVCLPLKCTAFVYNLVEGDKACNWQMQLLITKIWGDAGQDPGRELAASRAERAERCVPCS